MKNEGYYIIAIIILAVLLFILLALFALHCAKIRHELKHVNMEIERTSGDEKREWQRVKKHLVKAIFYLK